jgi:hypothetical protein
MNLLIILTDLFSAKSRLSVAKSPYYYTSIGREKNSTLAGGCCCGGGFCPGGTSCGCGVGLAVAPMFIGHVYSGQIAIETSMEGALKFNLLGSSCVEPTSFFQRHFEGKQIIEQMSYFNFFDGIRAVLCQLGFKKIVCIKLDHREVFNYNAQPQSTDDLEAGIASAQNKLQGSYKSILHNAEISAVRKTDSFHEHIAISYSQKHDFDKHALLVYLKFAPNEAVQSGKESLVDFDRRLDATYISSAKTDFLANYNKIGAIFQLSDDNRVVSLEDFEGREISLTPQ